MGLYDRGYDSYYGIWSFSTLVKVSQSISQPIIKYIISHQKNLTK